MEAVVALAGLIFIIGLLALMASVMVLIARERIDQLEREVAAIKAFLDLGE